MSTQIHPTAVVDPAAQLGADVVVGPYCVIGPQVSLGDGCRLHAHVNLDGITHLGPGCEIFPFASLGTIPQDLKFGGEETRLEIGARNRIREHVTMNTGTAGGGGVTRVGDGGLFMMGCHVAHDCVVGDGVIMANNATLAGHVEVGDFAVLGGLCAVHQFVKIGNHAMIGGMTGVEQDVVPFGLVQGERGTLHGLNLVGLQRRGFTKEAIRSLQEAVAILFAQAAEGGPVAKRVETLADRYAEEPVVQALVQFVRDRSRRGLCGPATGHALK